MKKKDKIKFVCMLTAGVLLLSACDNKTEVNTEKAIIDNVHETNISDGNALPDFENPYVAVSEDGYYFWESVRGRLMFLDKKSGKTVPLCNKPDCSHKSGEEDCNAFFEDPGDLTKMNDWAGGDGIVHEYLQYYDGSLYAVGCDSESYAALYRIMPDGSGEWEKCTRLYKTDYSSTGRWQTPDVFLDNGRVYYIDCSQEKEKLQSIGIDGRDEELIFKGNAEMITQIYRMKMSDGCLYFQVMTYENDNYENYEGGLYQYNPTTKECSMIKKMLVVPYSVRENWVYYGDSKGLCRYSMETGSTDILSDEPMDIPYIILTDDYIVVFNSDNSTLTLYDYMGQKIASALDPDMSMCWGGDSHMLFGQTINNGSTVWTVLNIKNIDERLQWEKITD